MNVMKIRELLNRLDEIADDQCSPLSKVGLNGDEEENVSPEMSPVPRRKKKKVKKIDK